MMRAALSLNSSLCTLTSALSKIYPAALRRGDEGAEVARESFGVVVEKLAHSFEAGRADDEADVVRLVHAKDDFGVVVGRRVLPLEKRRGAK